MNREMVRQDGNNENKVNAEPKLNKWVKIAALITFGIIALNQGLSILDRSHAETSITSIVSETALSDSPQHILLTRHPEGQDMASRIDINTEYDGNWKCATPQQISDFDFDHAGYQQANYKTDCSVTGFTIIEANGGTQLEINRDTADSTWNSQAVDLVPDKCLGSEGWWIFKDYFEHNCLQTIIRTPEADELARIDEAINKLSQSIKFEFTWRAPGEVRQYTQTSK